MLVDYWFCKVYLFNTEMETYYKSTQYLQFYTKIAILHSHSWTNTKKWTVAYLGESLVWHNGVLFIELFSWMLFTGLPHFHTLEGWQDLLYHQYISAIHKLSPYWPHCNQWWGRLRQSIPNHISSGSSLWIWKYKIIFRLS